MTRKKDNKRTLAGKRRSAMVFEELEPRLLLSADLPIDLPAVLAPDRGEDEPVAIHEEFITTAVTGEQYTAHELVFVDTDTPDYQLLVDDLLGNSSEDRLIEVVLLDNSSDGIAQITDTLSQHNELDAVHIISHGSEGSVDLGGTRLEFETLFASTTAIQGWSNAFSENGDFLIYGCNLAATETGQALVNSLARLTGADVAASDDLTGNAQLGGDWELEYQQGEIETSVAISSDTQSSWSKVLVNFSVNTTADTADTNPGNGLAEDGSNNTSLRAAIEEANALAGADTITIGAGAYTLSLGEITISSDITITGAGAGVTVIDGNSLSRVFDITSGTVTISNLTIQGGGGGVNQGGGIQVAAGADLTLTDSVVTNNASSQGAGLYNSGTLTITTSEITSNTATFRGGGITNTGTLVVTDSTIDGNMANDGGGLNNEGTATLSGVTISNNIDGGGIANTGAGTMLTLMNTTISGNTSISFGGGIMTSADFSLTNVTITDNSAGSQGGGIKESGGGNTLEMRNTIIAGNFAPTSPDVDTTIESLGYNLIGDSTGSGGWIASDQQNADPLLGALADNGGPTLTHALLTGSTAINAGTSTGAPITDQLGAARDDGLIDIGAYEFDPSLPAILITSRETVDADADGQIDHIRITTDQNLDDDFSGLSMAVSGYTVNGYVTNIGAGGVGDNVFYVELQESGTPDTGATPWVTVEDNTSLGDAGGNIAVEGEVNEFVFEAEEYATHTSTGGIYSWEPANSVPGYSGTGYLEAVPSDGFVASDYTTEGAEVTYEFEVVTPGTYEVHFRTYSSGSGADSLYWGVDDVYMGQETTDTYGAWTWWTGDSNVTLTAGVHTLNIWMRESDQAIDQIVINQSATLPYADNTIAAEVARPGVRSTDDAAPLITSNGGGATAAVNVAENTTAVTTVTATEPSSNFAITGGADAALFSIDTNTGALTFISAPDFESPADANADNIYEVTAQASDGTATDTQAISVTVTDANDSPTLWDFHHTINLGTSTAVNDYPVEITLTEGVNGFNHMNAQANGEDLRFYDSAGIALSYWIEEWNVGGTSTVWVEVGTTGTSSIDMYYGNADVAAASDPDASFLFYEDFADGSIGALPAGWSLAQNAPSPTPPSVQNDSGNLVFSDGANGGGPVIDTGNWADIVVSQDFRTINSSDPISHAGLIARYEDVNNMVYGGIVDKDTAQLWFRELGTFTQIGGDWSITGLNVDDGNWHNQELRVFGDTVVLYIDDTFIGSASLVGTGSAAGTTGQTGFWSQYSNYESYRDNHIVRSYDGGTGDITTTMAIEGFAINENSANSTVVGSVIGTDPDIADTLTYSITGGNTGSAFAIDNNGQITVNNSAALDFETTPIFNLAIQVDDSNGGTDTGTVKIQLNNINDAPVISSDGGGAVAAINVVENTTAVTTLNATDADLDTLTYSISGGADTALFSIDSNTGVLTFDTAPDFENPADNNGDNVYEVTVQVSDGNGGTDAQSITVNVTNVADGIRITPINVVPVGSETLVNTNTTDVQMIGANVAQAIATDANGNYVVVWASNLQDDVVGYGIYAQQYNADGTAQGSEFLVNTVTADSQMNPAVAMDAAGNFVITWQSNLQDSDSYGIYAQRYDAAGVAQGTEFLVNSTTTDYQGSPTIAMDVDGDFVIAWVANGQDPDASLGIYAQRFDASGAAQGGEFRVNTYTTGTQQITSISMDAAGNFVITWASLNQDGSNYGIFGQRYDASGVAQGAEFQVNTTTANSQLYHDVVMLPDGRFVVEYQSRNADGSYEVFMQRYAVDGSAVGGEIRVNTTTVSSAQQPISSITADASGNITVVWNSDADGAGTAVVGQRFDWAGDKLGSEFVVNTTTAGDQQFPEVVAQPDGGFIVVWGGNGPADADGVFMQRYSLATTEDGESATLQIVLESAPTADVTIPISISDATEGILSLGSVTFTASNWNTPQTVKVTGIKDFINDGDQRYQVLFGAASSADSNFNGLNLASLTITNVDVPNQAPSVVDDAYTVDEDNTLTVDWWDSDWTRRQQLSFDNLAQTETLTDMPVLIVLNASNIDYSQTNDDGSDLRFFAADGTPLAYEIEQWNEGGDSTVWVKVPQITGNSNADSITMYYGNAAAISTESPGDVWDSNFVGVWHLNQDQAGAGDYGIYTDSTANNNDGKDNVVATGQEGSIADGQELDANDWIEVAHDPSLDLTDSMTISFWIKPNSDSGNFNRVVEKGLWGYNNSYYFGGGNGTNDLTFYLNGQEVFDTADDVLTVGVWQHTTVSYTSNGDGTGTARLFLNGVEITSGNYTAGAVVGNTERLAIGHADSLYDFDGFVDEIQISNTDRSADWIAAQYQATRNQFGNEFVSFGGEQSTPATSGVLANDSDLDGDPLTVTLVAGPTQAASFALNKDGTFTYAPIANYHGVDTFTYEVNDGNGGIAQATATITVDPVADLTATDDAFSTNEDAALNADVSTNDSTTSGGALSYALATGAANGSVTMNVDGTFTYTPTTNFNGADSFTYTLTDAASGESDTRTVNLTVNPVTDLTATDDTFSTNEDTVLNADVSTNDSTTSGGTLTYAVATGASNGSVSMNGDGTFTYTPTSNYTGGDSFTYTVTDAASGESSTQTVTITVDPVTDLSATDDAFSTNEDTVLNADVSTNDSTTSGGALSYVLATGAANGSVVVNNDGTFTYTPNSNYTGSDSFTYTVTDAASGESDTRTVSLTVDPVADLTATDDAFSTNEDTVLNADVSTNDSTTSGGALSYALATGASNGSVVVNTNGTFTYTPGANYTGADSFTYTVTDAASGESDTRTVSLTVDPVTDLTATDDAFSTNEDTVLNADVSTNDSTTSGGALSYALATGASNGSVTLNGDGTFTYTPGSNYTGADSFTYTVTDAASGESDTRTVSLTVDPVADLTATDDAFSTNEDTVLNADVSTNDSTTSGGALSYALAAGATNGGVVVNNDGTFTYTPGANYTGADSFTYTVTDAASGESDTRTVSLTVDPVSDLSATDDAFSINEDIVLNADVSTNDSTTSGGALSYALAAGATNGSVVVNNDGTFTYTSGANYTGADSFTYTVTDAASGESDTRTVSLTVDPVSDLSATDDAFSTNEDTVLNADVSTNDSTTSGGALSYALATGASNGSVSMNADGTFSYTPTANYTGSDSFTYTVTDAASGESSTQTVTITVDPVTDLTATDESFSTNEDTALNADVSTNDSTTSGGALSYAVATGASNGSVSMNADGTFSYTPTANYTGSDSFTYTVTDAASGESDTRTVSLTVDPVTDLTATDDAFSTNEDTVLNADVSTNDSTTSGGALSYALATGASNGSVTLNGDGTFTYTPGSNYTGADSFTYTVTDAASGESDTRTVSLTVDPVADLTATDDAFSTNEDTVLNADVSTNDSTTSGGALSYALATGASNGTLALNVDGTFTYTPGANYTGADSFTYTVTDAASGESDTRTVSLTINPVNDIPSAVNDAYTTNEDTPFTATLGVDDLLQNDSDLDGDTLTVNTTPIVDVSNGTLVLNADGTFTYTPTANFNGSDSFTYEISDGNGGTAQATVTLTVDPVNDAPVAVNDAYTTNEDTPFTATLGVDDLLFNDSDIDGDTLTVNTTPVVDVSNGTLVLNTDGTFTYTPTANFNGSDSFTYEISDGNGGTAQATVTITVDPVNDAPTAVNDAYTTNEDTPFTATLGVDDLLQNDSDIDGDTLTVNTTPVVDVSNGTLVLNADGTFTYTPTANFNGSDSFTYEISDGNGGTAQATVTITVDPVNDNPTAVNDAYTTNEDTPFTATLGVNDLLFNDSDIDGDTLTVNTTPVVDVSNGTLVLNADGTFTYTPTANFNGSDSFTYEISDGNGGTAQATVTITVDPVNDAPVAVNDVYTTNEDTPFTATLGVDDLLFNDSDIDGDTLTVNTTPVVDVSNGTLVLNADGTFTYTPMANLNGSDSFTYEVSDGNGGTAQATVTITVDPVNDVPIATADTFTVNEGSTTNLNLSTNDSDADDDLDLTSITIVSGPANGSLVVNANGTVDYTHDGSETVADSFAYTIGDLAGATSNTVTVNLTITLVNDAPVLIGANNLTTISEDAVSNAGTGVSDLISGHVTDTDAGALTGIAVVGVDNANGSWEFSTNSGSTWTSLGTPSSINARLLAADVSTLVRFVPNADYNGTVVGGLSFHAWDQTSGLNGEIVNISGTDAVIDGFDSVSYANNDGTQNWTTDWIESDNSGGGASGGFIYVNGGSLQLNVSAGDLGDNIYREIELSGATSATLNYDYQNLLSGEDEIRIQVSGNGGSSYTTVMTFTGTQNTGSNSASIDIGGYIASDTRIRIHVFKNDAGASLLIDNVEVVYDNATTAPGGESAFSSGSQSSDIDVTPVNDAPTAVNGAYTTNEDTPFTATLGVDDLLFNDSDIDGDTLTVNTTPVVDVSNGTLVLNADGTFTYTPTANFNGSDSFTYEISDGNGGTAQATVTITVDPVNDAPVAVNDVYTTNEDTPFTATLGVDDLLFNDSDIDGDTLTVNTTPVVDVSNGTLVLNADGTFTYTPTANFNGSDSFTYEISDGNGGTAQATVTITVDPVNDNPTAVNDSYTTNEDTPFTATLGVDDLIFNDSDTDGDTLTVNITPVVDVSNGTLVLNADGTFTYTPTANFNGSDSFTYEISDGNAGTAQATVTITVDPVNDAPVAVNDSFTVNEGSTTNLNLAANDTDADDGLDATSITIVSGPSNGSIVVNGDGTVDYTHDDSETIADNFTYTLNDTSGATSTVGTVNLTIDPVNDAPIHSVPAAQSTPGDTPLIFSNLNGNSITVADPDASGAAMEVTLSVSNGALSLAGTSGLSFNAGDGTGDTSMTFTGTAADINAALNGLSFQADADYEGMATVQIITDDLGNVGTGGALNALDRVNITVAASAPTGSPQDTLPPLDELIAETFDTPVPEPVITPVKRVNVNPAAEEATEAKAPASGSDTTTATSDAVVDVILGSGRGIATQADVSLPGLVPLFDQNLQPHDDDRPSSVRLIGHVIRQGLVDPFTYAKILNPLQPNAAIWESIDAMMEQMDGRDASWYGDDQVLTTTTATGLTVSFTVGYVSWLLRAGYLSASLMSVLPLWREFDPLPVLAATKKKKRKSVDRDKDSREMNDIESESIFTSSETD